MRCGALDVRAHTAGYVLRLLLRYLPDALGGDADDEATGREFLVFRDQCTSSNDGAFAYLRPVEDRGAHSYQATIFYLAAVHDGPVADDAIVAHYGQVAGVGVQHAAVLDVGAGADPDRLRVSPQHRPVPDARLLSEMHISDHVRPRRDPRGRGVLRECVAVREQVAAQIQRRTRAL